MIHQVPRFAGLRVIVAAVALYLPTVATTNADEFGARDVGAAPVSPDHYILRLEDPYNGSLWPIDMHIEYRDGQFGRTWIVGLWRLMGSDEPRLVLDPSRLQIDESGLRGIVQVHLVDKPNHIQNTLEFELELDREGSVLEGRWKRQFGDLAEQHRVSGKVSGRTDAPGRLTMKLNSVMHGYPPGGDYLWLVLLHDENQITGGWGEAERTYNPLKHTVDISGLDFDGETLSGMAGITLLPDGHVPKNQQPVHCVVSLDAKVVGDRIEGEFTGRWNAPLTWSGKAQGEVLSEGEWLSKNRIATGGKAWPAWLGPYGNGTSQIYGQRLVDKLSEAKLVWKSEDTPSGRSQKKQLGRGFPDGGASSPIVKDGRVYLFYNVPHGGEYDKRQEAIAQAVGITDYDTRLWSILADEVLLCVDAVTGRTLWKTVFPGKGLYWLPGKDAVANLTPCVFNGRVYAIGTTGRIYCADAVTGRKLWESDIGPKHDALKAYVGQCLIERRFGGHPGMPRVSTPTFSESDDVLLTSDFQLALDVRRGNHGLIGVDGRTGRVLWRLEGVLGLWASPIRWVFDGKEFVIAGNVKGELRCIDPKTGRVQWQVADIGQFWNEPSIVGDYLLAPVGGLQWSGSNAVGGGYAHQSGCRLGCYRLSPRGAQRLWLQSSRYEFPGFDNICGRDGYVYLRSDNRHLCIELETGEIVASEDRDPLRDSAGAGRIARSGSGVNALWEQHWVYAPNFTTDSADGATPILDKRKFHMFHAEPQNLKLLDTTLLPHKRFSTDNCRGLSWPYVDGRIFIRGGDGIYCYDLRAPNDS